jgi:hypothetical protein
VTWGNGNTGISGTVSNVNSLVGSNPGDLVGGYENITPLSNGNYVVSSPSWNGNVGAVTWGDGSTGTSGTVSVANSLVGSNPGDQVGASSSFGGRNAIVPLSNGGYVILSPFWNSNRGAATWGNGSTGTSGILSESNSLVGSNPGGDALSTTPGDLVGFGGVTPLSNGNYVVASPFWNRRQGAVTWGNGSLGTSGTLVDSNSLVGTGPSTLTPLSNGNYVVSSSNAVTWGNGSTGTSGTISAANSLVRLGTVFQVIALSNGNYVVDTYDWNGNRGAVTWGDGSTGVSGTISTANSLIGSNPGDLVGATWVVGSKTHTVLESAVIALSNGNYLVGSPLWNSKRGAVTWGDGATGVSGPVSEDNSLIGTDPGDMVGVNPYGSFGIILDFTTFLSNGDYLVGSPYWNGNRGAVTWVSGTSGQTLDGLGTITPQNSILGTVPNAALGTAIENPAEQTFLAPFENENGGRVTAGVTDPNHLTFGLAQSQALTITPDFLTRTLDTDTTVVLQASNDIAVNAPISVSAGGKGGALTLQAGRSIVLNANITTDNGPLTLIANDRLADGAVDAERDPGPAVISMAPDTTLDTGSGPLRVELGNGTGLTNSESGAITLQSVTAGSVSVANDGPSTGSDVNLGSVTTSGVQSYADPNGTAQVSGNLTAANPITFDDSVVLNDGVRVDAGFGTVNFAGRGLQLLQSGAGATLGNVLHNGTGTLQLTSVLTVRGRFTNQSGTFDANNQPVTVSGLTTVAGGAYLAGTAPQQFNGSLVILAGVFASSTGPMNVRGGVILTGGSTSFGLLSGVGTVDTLTSLGGWLTPGGTRPGVLTISGPLALNLYTTVSIVLEGTTPNTGYAQLQAGGPIDLGNSTLSLNFGFVPPVGSSFEILTNTGSSPIRGTFSGLAEGAVFSQSGYQFQLTYQGGTGGNSAVLTRLV